MYGGVDIYLYSFYASELNTGERSTSPSACFRRLLTDIPGPLCSLDIVVKKQFPACSGRVQTERDGTRAETRFGLPAKRTSPFISAGVSVQSSTGFLGMRVGRERL